jgi:hypothetical protein
MTDLDDWNIQDRATKAKANFLIGVSFNLASAGRIPSSATDCRSLVAVLTRFTDAVFAQVDRIMENSEDSLDD